MDNNSILLKDISELVTVSQSGERCKRGAGLRELETVHGGAVAISGDKIAWVGPTAELPDEFREGPGKAIDCRGKTVLPGFVDCHTHFVFAGSREEEFAARCEGRSYAEIAAAGGGIKSTMRATRAAAFEDLLETGRKRLNQMLLFGTTTVECKSGYGLDLETEAKMLKVMAELGGIHPITVVPTFLGAHAVPDGISRSRYLAVVLEKMIPYVAEHRLAEFCDVFCDEGAFTVDESRFVLNQAKQFGLIPKIHTDQFASIGGCGVAAEVGAISADHLDVARPRDIELLAASDIAGVLLPGCVLFLGLSKYAPARRMIDSELPIALATDFNPGSCNVRSMPHIMTIACTMMHMHPYEAIAASTLNAAYALGRSDRIGSIERGKIADLVLCDAQSAVEIPYQFGVNLVNTVIKDGVIVVRDGQLV
ncbi:MAG TPA: imidazolonepropionase [bacterium]|nr:imidazolonepropionase [bacterium]